MNQINRSAGPWLCKKFPQPNPTQPNPTQQAMAKFSVAAQGRKAALVESVSRENQWPPTDGKAKIAQN
jgi:hypothetical protein